MNFISELILMVAKLVGAIVAVVLFWGIGHRVFEFLESRLDSRRAIIAVSSFFVVMSIGLIFLAVVAADFLRPRRSSIDKAIGFNKDIGHRLVAPGDGVTIEIPSTLESIGGHWVGDEAVFDPTITSSQQASGLRLEPLPGKTRSRDWGTRIAEAPTEDFRIWIKIRLSGEPKMANQVIRGWVKMDVIYPVPTHRKFEYFKFENAERHVELPASFRVSDPTDVSLYKRYEIVKWLLFILAGTLFLVSISTLVVIVVEYY